MSDVLYRVVIRVARGLFRVLGLRLDVRGAERLPVTGPVVLAANHSSFVDFMVVGLPADERGRLVRFMAKESVFRSATGGPLMRGMRHIPVDRRSGTAAALRARRALLAGEMVGVYPEATIGHAFTLKARSDLTRGAAHLAIATGAPLVPVAHWGLHRVFTVGPRWSLRRGRWVGIQVGQPLYRLPGETPAELTGRLHDALRELVEGLLDRYPDVPADPSRAWWWPAHRGGAAPAPDAARELDRRAVAEADGVPYVRSA
ncbi:lysophospholipid acyltransferase family protein [Phycicoccus duodecadis]|uniref:1-acyl-sn-glycerol-3-phosphate acyltransferase n=1 Tax=Phycicoccus duodecadis TaxID=173053 RepID=A0A2N3YF47_9MICO|nr:lysophospholipid acyltransferase family protein [Phycicoccus duodecadis]PKW25469.1 1-acyl-sn-glycerol-3-phosphate acyltransferase [Phycicoccus duodecadis]